MTITVGAIYSAFPTFNPKDMIKLCNGNENLNGRTVVPLANIAALGNKDLSVFAAKKEGKNYTNLLGKQEQASVNAAAGIKETGQTPKADKDSNNAQVIPMDKSVFDIADPNKKKAV